MAGSIEFYASRWRDALTLCERAETLLREQNSRSEWDFMTAHSLGLASLAYLGELRALRRRQTLLLDEARQRGNLLAAVCLACGPASIGWLAADDPGEAARQADDALAPWRAGAFQLPQYLHLVAKAQTALYAGDAREALRIVDRAWPRVVTSMTLYVQNLRVTLRHLRARCALAVAAQSSRHSLARRRMLRLARAEASRLAREDVAWAPPLAMTIEGGVLATTGEIEGAAERFERAAAALRSVDMKLFAAATDHEHGRLIGGAAGRALRTIGESSMIDEDVAAPERLAAMLVPGVTGRA
jgi:hypothetical protein